MREYLQAHILAALQDEGAMIPLAFHGGTALRFLYQLPRFSEDLNFALEKKGAHYDFGHLMRNVRNCLEKQGYKPIVKINDSRIVHSAFITFEELLHEFNLTGHRQELLSIKVEVDTQPPDGALLDTSVIKQHIPLHLQHHDRSSLFAGKLHAILQRPFVKGRDLYDLVWYLSDPSWPEPNVTMLNYALGQTGWSGGEVSLATWRHIVLDRINALNLTEAGKDVSPFLENSNAVQLVKKETIVKLLSRGIRK